MHDSSLRRTTNVREVYPNDTAQNAALFSWDALKELNAGAWFLKVSTINDCCRRDTGWLQLISMKEEKLFVEPSRKSVEVLQLGSPCFVPLAFRPRRPILFGWWVFL